MEVPQAITSAFVARPVRADKYSVGTVAVVGGSVRYPNAPVIAALGARAAGAGLVRLVALEASRIAAGFHVPEATFEDASSAAVLPRADVVVLGMGLGLGEDAKSRVRGALFDRPGKFVVDADALTVLAAICAEEGASWRCDGQEVVLTPHEGEAARLLGCAREEVARDRRGAAREIASRYSATVVLKGAGTIVVPPDGSREYVNGTGNPFMAVGGAGDLLAGAIGARWAYLGSGERGAAVARAMAVEQGNGLPSEALAKAGERTAFLAAAGAAWLHGAAGDKVVAEGRDPSIACIASAIGELRVRLDSCPPATT